MVSPCVSSSRSSLLVILYGTIEISTAYFVYGHIELKEWVNILTRVLFTIIFLFGIGYLIRYRLNLKKAAELTKGAQYPKNKSEFASILIPTEWKEMEPLTKLTKSYQFVKWATVTALLLLAGLAWIVLATDWLNSAFFTIAYLFFWMISSIQHRGNLYLLPNGLIMNGKYYSIHQIKHYETEQIVRWHELYGLDPRVNNAYKLTIKSKRRFQSHFFIVEDCNHLEQIQTILEKQGIHRVEKS